MKAITYIFILLIACVFLSCTKGKEKNLLITGTTINTNTKSILLVKPHQNMMFDSILEIPVRDGKFHYTSKLNNPEAVKLFLGEAKESATGSYMPLFLENEKIELIIYPEEEFSRNVVNGGKLNEEFKKFKKDMNSKVEHLQSFEDSLSILTKNYEAISNKRLILSAELEKVKGPGQKLNIESKLVKLDGQEQMIISQGTKIQEKLNSLYSKRKEFQKKFMKNNSTLVSYFFLLNDLISYTPHKEIYGTETIDIVFAKKKLDTLKKVYPDHPYNNLSHSLINAIENIKIGKEYIDFSAPDTTGKSIRLSDQIEGKIAILNLWATWCAPCIKKSRTLVPIFHEFKDKGFTIVGVAGEYKNTDRFVQFLEKEKWPWLNLIELDRQNNIWQKYGINNTGGGIFLIDENGKILAKDPTAEEVKREILNRIN